MLGSSEKKTKCRVLLFHELWADFDSHYTCSIYNCGVAFTEHIFRMCMCICNSLKAHTHFGKCHVRDTDTELVRKQLFCPHYFVPSETQRGSVPMGDPWGSVSLHIIIYMKEIFKNFIL